MNNQISYIIPSRLPTEKAYGFQILKTCSTLSHKKNINNINVIYPKRENFIKENAFEYYDLKLNNKIKLLEFGNYDIFERFKLFGEKFSFKLHIFSFLIKIFLNKNILFNNIIILRDFNIIFFFILLKPFLKYKAIFYESHEKIYLNLINKFFLKKIDFILPISKNLFKYYKKINSNIKTTNSITDKNKIVKEYLLKDKFKKKIKLNNNQLSIGIIGHSTTLGIDKGSKKLFDYLIKISNFNFFFVGLDDNNFDSFSDSINKNSVKNIFIFKKIKFKNIYKFYDICDCFIIYYPNFDYFNNSSPVKIFECLATGKPIICNDNISILSILEKDKNCLVFDTNFNDFESKILELQNKNVRNIISENNISSFKKYSIENKIELLNSLIKKYARS